MSGKLQFVIDVNVTFLHRVWCNVLVSLAVFTKTNAIIIDFKGDHLPIVKTSAYLGAVGIR